MFDTSPVQDTAPVQAITSDTPDAAEGQPNPSGALSSTFPQVPQQPAPRQQQGSQSQPPMVSNPGAKPTDAVIDHPAIRRAGVLHSIAETLAGGPRVRTTVDPTTGETKREPVRLTGGQIAMALALEAISGSLTGLAAGRGRGPGAAGAAAFAQAEQRRRQETTEEEKQADRDVARHYQVLETNMRLYNNALQAGRSNLEANTKYVEQFKPLADKLQADFPDAIQGIMNESELVKYGIHKESAIPYRVVPRMDATGQQVRISGEPKWDVQYLVVDPHISIPVSGEDKALFARLRIPGYADGSGNQTRLPQNMEIELWRAINLKAQAGAFHLMQSDLNSFFQTLNKGGKGKYQTPDLEKAVQADPTLLSAVTKFQAVHNQTEHIGQAIAELSKKDPQSAGRIAALYGGRDAINQYDLLQDAAKTRAEAQARADVEIQKEKTLGPIRTAEAVNKERQLVPIHVAEAKQKQDAIDKDSIEAAAQSLASGDLTSLKDIASMRNDQRLKVYTRTKQLNPNFNTKDVEIKTNLLKAYSTGKQGDQIQSFNAFLGHAGEAAQASADYRRVGSPLINKPLNWLSKNVENDPTYQTFITALQPVRDEYMTFLQNNHALTESDKKAADVILSNESTPAQIESALKQMAKTAFIRLDSLNDRYRRVMGSDFPDMLNDESISAANLLGLGSHAARFQTGGSLTGSASGGIPGKQPIYANNPKTGQRAVSFDGGRSWQLVQQ